METASIKPEDFKKLMQDVALIKHILVEERELTDWAKNELEEARRRPKKISHEEVKRKLLGK